MKKQELVAGIYKMASSLGGAIGVAVSAAIYNGLASEKISLKVLLMV